MKRTLLITCGVVLGAFALTLLGAFLFLSPDWQVTRSRTIEAPGSQVHAVVADLHGWPEWTAWGRDAGSEASWSFEGQPAGRGAVMRWDAPRFGEGHLTILKADAAGIEYEMVLEQDGSRTVAGTVVHRPVAGGTEVTWTDRGEFGWNPVLRLLKGPFTEVYGKGLEDCLEGLASRVEAAGR